MSLYVNPYEASIRAAFHNSVSDDIPEDSEKLIIKISDDICEAVSERIRDRVRTWLLDNIKDDICREAARVAESMLMNALAGDDKELRNLFGFSDWYMSHLYVGALPTQWRLMEKLIERHPDLFVSERIAQLDKQVEEQSKTIARLQCALSSARGEAA